MNSEIFWFLARASGITAYLLISASMIAGIVLKSRPFGAALKAPIALDVHRFITSLALAAIGVHGLALVADSTVEITFGDLLIPFAAPYKPLWTGLGVIAADLALIVAISFPLKKRIGGKNWRRLHWATYSIFVFSTAHGIAAGTDTAQPWADADVPRSRRRSRLRNRMACVRRSTPSRSPTERSHRCTRSRSTSRCVAASEPAPS